MRRSGGKGVDGAVLSKEGVYEGLKPGALLLEDWRGARPRARPRAERRGISSCVDILEMGAHNPDIVNSLNKEIISAHEA